MKGYDWTTFSQHSTSVNLRIAASLELVITPTPHVPLSAGSVSSETEPYGCNKPPKAGGIDPSADRKWRPGGMKPQSSIISLGPAEPASRNQVGTADRRPPESTTRSA